MINQLNMLSFIILSLCFKPVCGDNIVFDLDRVLFHTNERVTLHYMKLSNAIKGMIIFKEFPSDFKNHIKAKFDEILYKVSSANAETFKTENCGYDVDGNLHAPIICSWLDGTKTNEEIRTLVLSSIEANNKWFDAKVEQKIVSNLVNMVFTAENFISTRKLYKNSFRMLLNLKQEGHKIYFLSNWDAESFNLLKSKYPELFAIVDGAMVSGEINSLKPSPKIYEALLKHYNLDPDKTWFIDNQQDNINAASDLKMHGILCERTGHRKRPDTVRIGQALGNVGLPSQNK